MDIAYHYQTDWKASLAKFICDCGYKMFYDVDEIIIDSLEKRKCPQCKREVEFTWYGMAWWINNEDSPPLSSIELTDIEAGMKEPSPIFESIYDSMDYLKGRRKFIPINIVRVALMYKEEMDRKDRDILGVYRTDHLGIDEFSATIDEYGQFHEDLEEAFSKFYEDVTLNPVLAWQLTIVTCQRPVAYLAHWENTRF
jgi:hypothetical protein